MLRFDYLLCRGLALAALVAAAGCTVAPDPMPGDPAWAPVTALTEPPPAPADGSLYRGAAFGISLYDDRRALRVGDILTIILSERTTASKNADTELTKDSEIGFDGGTVLGDQVTFGDYGFQTEINQERDFEGEAESDQSNQLEGSIAVTVAEVLPNGLLVVRGEKWMTLNTGEEFIRISGLVRPEDIGPDNTILSTRLADARIAYSGTGAFAQTSTQGWLGQFFSSKYWPF